MTPLRAGVRKADKAAARFVALLLIGLLSSLWRFLCFAGTALEKTRHGAFLRASCQPESDTLVKTPEDLDIGNALPDDEVFQAQVTDAELERRYAEGMRQSSLSPEFQEALGWAGTAQEVFDLLDRRREYLLLADALAALKKLIKKPSKKSRQIELEAIEPSQLFHMDDFKHLVTFQTDVLLKQNMYLTADVLIQSAQLGSDLESLDMDQGRPMLAAALAALEKALDVRLRYGGRFNLLNTDLPKILASVAGGHGQIREKCLEVMSNTLGQQGPKGLLATARSLVESKDKLNEQDRKLLRRVLERTVELKQVFSGNQMVQMLYRSALLDEYHEGLLQATTRKAATNIGLISDKELGLLANAVTRFDFRDRTFLGMLARATTWRAAKQKMDGTSLSHILLCLSHFSFVENDMAINDAVEKLKMLLGKYRTGRVPIGALARSLKALAQLQHRDDDFLKAAAEELTQFTRRTSGALDDRPQDFEYEAAMVARTDDISAAVAAMAALEYRNVDFMEAVHELLAKHVSYFTFGGLANILWSLAVLESTPELEDIIAAAAVQLPKPQPQDLVRMAWAFAQLERQDSAFLNLLKREVEEDLPRFQSLLPDLAWALQKLQAADDVIVKKLADEAETASNLDGMGWMTLILTLDAHPAEDGRIDGLLSRCAAKMAGALRQQTDSSLLALDWLLKSVNVPEDVWQFRDEVATQVATRKLDSCVLETMFTKEGACLQVLPGESRIFRAT